MMLAFPDSDSKKSKQTHSVKAIAVKVFSPPPPLPSHWY